MRYMPSATACPSMTGLLVAGSSQRTLRHLRNTGSAVTETMLETPVWMQLRYLIPLLLGVLVTALVLLGWRFTRRMLRLVHAEAQARGVLSASLRELT